MRVIVPVAGQGTRLRPHTFTQPKPLLPVAGKEILGHILDPVATLAPTEVILVVGFMGELVEQYVRDTYDFPSRFVRQEKLLGLGHALNMALADVHDGPVLIILGDTIVDCDLHAFVREGDNVLGLRQVDDPRRFGVAEVKGGRIVSLVEKPEHPRTNLAIIGLYYFSDVGRLKPHLQAHVESGRTTRGEIQFTDALQQMITAGETLVPFEVQGWYDCGKPETMLETNRHLLAHRAQPVRVDGATIIDPVAIGEGVTIKASVIGPYVSISRGTVVRRSIIQDSIIGADTLIEDAVLEQSLIGRGVTVRGQRHRLNLGDSSEVTCG